MTHTPVSEPRRLADQLERAVRGGAWHGPALLEVFAEVDGATAVRRPAVGTHSIAEIVEHVSLWTEICRRRIVGPSATDAALPEDWTPVAGTGDADAVWAGIVATFEERHCRLHATVAGLDEAQLDAPVAGADPTVRGLLLGLLQHHAYHAGQVSLLRGAARGPA